ncbi:MAG: hypothetical protein ACJ77N_11125 [Chloroflexota bacterium]|jgi:post-segregation antitoxin (ccd killing protein)
MRFIQEFGYSVKIGQEEAHQRWVTENHERIAGACPPGSRYIGTFAVVFSSEKQAGYYRALFELDSYAALDASAAAGKDASTEWAKVNREASAFFDLAFDAPWSSGLLKNVVDATIWDPGS